MLLLERLGSPVGLQWMAAGKSSQYRVTHFNCILPLLSLVHNNEFLAVVTYNVTMAPSPAPVYR